MIAAISILLVTSLLAGVAVAVATQTDLSTRRDANKKNALEAAEAGLQVAAYRLNMEHLTSNNSCLGSTVESSPDNGMWCTGAVTSLGNGSTYQFFTSRVLQSGDQCVGLTVVSSQTISQRCVTAVGTSNGVSARSQIRIAAFAATPLFPVSGITGLQKVQLNGNVTITGYAASNYNVNANGNINLSGVDLGPGASFTHNGNGKWPTPTPIPTIVLDPVNPGTSNQTSLANCPGRQVACNDDYRITNGLASPRVMPYDDLGGQVSWNTTTRMLTLNGNNHWTISGGLYNLCGLTVNGNSTIALASGVRAEIIIDSPDDPGSGCPAGSGSVTMNGNVTWSNPSGDPTALQILAYGTNDNSSTVTINGNGQFQGVVYAPHSSLTLNGNAAYVGAASANQVTFNGNSFAWDNRAGSLQANTTGVFYRTAWAQCTPTIPGSNPGASCG